MLASAKLTHKLLLSQRRMQGAAFTPDAMDAYLPRVVATCEAYLQQWASQDNINLVPAVSLSTRASNLRLPGFHLIYPHIIFKSPCKGAMYI